MTAFRMVLLAAVAVFVSSGVTGFFASRQPEALSAFAPFVAFQQEQSFSESGKTPGRRDRVFARRQDGSSAASFTVVSPAGETGTVTEIVEVVQQRYVSLEPFTTSAMTVPLSGDELRQRLLSGNKCEDNEVKQQLALHRADRSTRPFKILDQEVIPVSRSIGAASRRLKVESWVALNLDCFALSETVTTPGGARTERWTVKIDLGAPPQSMFEIPSTYTERSPAEIDVAYGAKYPGKQMWKPRDLKSIEQRYWSRSRQ